MLLEDRRRDLAQQTVEGLSAAGGDRVKQAGEGALGLKQSAGAT